VKPRWRWLLFCVTSDIVFRVRWKWAVRLMSWCVLPEWVATDEEIAGVENVDPPWEDS
jgi:hypothetical protein